MRSSTSTTDDTTSSVLLTLLKLSLAEQGIAPLPQRKGISNAVAALSEKETLSECVLRVHGPEALLAVGQVIPKLRTEPIVACLLSAQNPTTAISRWVRLQRYAHIKHPAKIVAQSESHVEFLHADTGKGPPIVAADLLLVSVIGALISMTGGEKLSVELGRDTSAITIFRNGKRCAVPEIVPECETGRWRFKWANSQNHTLRESALRPQYNRYCDAATAFIEEDLLKTWTLRELSSTLNVSARTLQRRLIDEGTSLSHLVRDARVRCAIELLACATHSLGSIGFACGFSDPAHFARAFRQRMGIPPSSYREMMDVEKNPTPPVSPSGVRRSAGP